MKNVVITLLLFSTALLAREAGEIVATVCYECHGTKMNESCMGVSQAPNTLDAVTIREALTGYRSGERSTYGMGSTMQEKVSELSDGEIKALSEYIPTLQ